MSKRKPQRRRKVPRSIAGKTDREIMEACFPKRVLDEADRVLADCRRTAGEAARPER
ncbi:MAG: hypothetical protein OXU75_11155 [Deltaproteobacteria bacterium]|nr:hypothetical protein [Deltaproteobacteria bacterium]